MYGRLYLRRSGESVSGRQERARAATAVATRSPLGYLHRLDAVLIVKRHAARVVDRILHAAESVGVDELRVAAKRGGKIDQAHLAIGRRPLELPRRRNPLNLGLPGYNTYGAAWLSELNACLEERHAMMSARGWGRMRETSADTGYKTTR